MFSERVACCMYPRRTAHRPDRRRPATTRWPRPCASSRAANGTPALPRRWGCVPPSRTLRRLACRGAQPAPSWKEDTTSRGALFAAGEAGGRQLRARRTAAMLRGAVSGHGFGGVAVSWPSQPMTGAITHPLQVGGATPAIVRRRRCCTRSSSSTGASSGSERTSRAGCQNSFSGRSRSTSGVAGWSTAV